MISTPAQATGARPETGRHLPRPKSEVNVGGGERLACALLGIVMLGAGVRRGGAVGALAGIAGLGLLHRGSTGRCPLYSRLTVSTVRGRGAEPRDYFERGVRIEESVVVRAGPGVLFDFWRRLENLPRVMSHIESVEEIGGGRSRWVARGPVGQRIEWDAQIINKEPNRLIAWSSLPGSQVNHAGTVSFRLVDGGTTEVRVVLEYLPPTGPLGRAAIRLLGEDPAAEIRQDLDRFRRMMERLPAPRFVDWAPDST